MTVQTVDTSVVYRGNGATTAFAVPFKVIEEDHLVVRSRVFATGEFEQTYIGTDYSYSGLGESSGTLTLAGTPLDDDYELVIERIVPYTQDLDIVNAGGFYPATVEEQLDLIVMEIQQLAELIGRALLVPTGEDGTTIARSSLRTGGKILGFNTITGEAEVQDEEDFRGPPGAPGGSEMAIGLFDNAEGIEIPAGVTRVQTSGYHSVGVGSAWYYAADSFSIVTYARAAFTAADGRVFRLDRGAQRLTPLMFGCVGDSATDDWAPLQEYMFFICNFACACAWLHGGYAISQTLVIGRSAVTTSTPATVIFDGGSFSLINTTGSVFARLLHLRYCRLTNFRCRLLLRGAPSNAGTGYTARDNIAIGLWLDECRGMILDNLVIERFWWAGVATDRNSNNSFIHINHATINYIGTGCEDAAQSLISTFSGASDTGPASDVTQRTNLTVPLGELPPATFESDIGALIGHGPTLVRIDEELYRVTGLTFGTGAMQVYPWLNPASGTSGSMTWIWGAAIHLAGNDCNCWSIDQIECQFVGIGLVIACNQGPTVKSFATQNRSGIGIVVGEQTVSPNTGNGTHITGFYLEDTHNHLINISDFADSRNSGFIAAEFTLEFSDTGVAQVAAIHGPRDGAGAIADRAMKYWTIQMAGDFLVHRNDTSVLTEYTFGNKEEVFIDRTNSRTITLDIDTRRTVLFNHTRQLYMVMGTGANYAPTGNIVFQLAVGSASLNGVVGGTLTYSGFDSAPLFGLFYDGAGGYQVSILTGRKGIRGTATWNPPSLAAGAQQTTTVTVTGAVLGDSVAVSFSLDLQSTTMVGHVSAADTVTVVHRNGTAGAVDLGSGTLTARVIR